MTYTFDNGPSDDEHGGADLTVYRAVSVNGAWYEYYYDAHNRRRAKEYPSGNIDEYFYDLSNELLVDEGNSGVDQSSYHTTDDYIWLGGRPVVIIRGRLNADHHRESDATTTCGRNDDPSVCGPYFPITDHIGKPVVMFDTSKRITGVGEYDPFGQVNRVMMDAETDHPFTSGDADFADFVQPTAGGLENDVRVKFQMLDLEASFGSCSRDTVTLTDKLDSSVLQTLSGNHLGTVWSDWLSPSTSGIQANLNYSGRGHLVCHGPIPIVCSCGYMSNTTARGAVVEGYEYRRYDGAHGATPFWTPLRFPGQYHDDETDLNQNWNRFYDPLPGAYRETDPLSIVPALTGDLASNGHAHYDYSYASNNPVAP